MKQHKSIFLFKNPHILIVLLFAMGMAGCNKLVEVDAPITNPTSASLYTSDAKAASVVTSLYAKMVDGHGFAQGTASIGVYAGLSADELEAYNGVGSGYWDIYTNSASVSLPVLWNELYEHIYIANAAIEGIAKSTGGITDSVKKQLTGEAKFMRAFLHFYVINLFGNAPYVTTTDYRANAVVSRTPVDQVYQQIIADLKEAQTLLKSNYVTPTGANSTERLRPNKGTATALLARVYLYLKQWANAEAEATSIINNTAYKLVTDPNRIFWKGSTETLWQLQRVNRSYNTNDGNMFLLTAAGPTSVEPVALRAAFLDNFEPADLRKASWVDSVTVGTTKYYYPKKYKVKGGGNDSIPPTEYLNVFRLAEQYLIRAEARAQQDKVTDAQADLDVVRTRATLGATTAADKASLLTAIEHERQVELFTEWGHRWLDLKRTNRADAVMSVVTPLKGGTWDTNMQLYPIPQTEILRNPNLAPQNPGYN